MAITQDALDILEDAGLGRAIFADVDPNPNDKNLEAGVKAFKDGGHDGVVAFGGGSGLDLGKAVAFMAGQTRPVWDFEDIGDWWTRAMPSRASLRSWPCRRRPAPVRKSAAPAVITNSETHVKKIIFHPKFLPGVVICRSGTDGRHAEDHHGRYRHGCLRALPGGLFLALLPPDVSQGIALEGMRLVKEFLPRAYRDGTDLEARANMMSAAAMGAVAFRRGSAPSMRCRTRSAPSTTPITA